MSKETEAARSQLQTAVETIERAERRWREAEEDSSAPFIEKAMCRQAYEDCARHFGFNWKRVKILLEGL